jgi:flagellar motor switch protein FliM
LRQLILDCPFRVELQMEASPVPLRELARLQPGGVLSVRHRIEEPAQIVAGEQEIFTGGVARRGPLRAAKIFDRIAPKEEQKREGEGREEEAGGSGVNESDIHGPNVHNKLNQERGSCS